MPTTILRFLLLGLLFGANLPHAGEPAPLTLEDVVRMHVSGRSVDGIVERIESSPVEFDLSEEMLEELRIAGIPQPVIEAMVARQAELHPGAEPIADPGGAEEPADRPLFAIRLRASGPGGDGEEPPVLRVLDWIGTEGRGQLQLATDDSRITDLAVFVACTTPTHVPDHWRGESALGRDFISMPRHRLLAFRPGASREPPPARSPEGSAVLALELPAQLEVELAADEEHDLLIGFAIRAEERYYRVASAVREKFRPREDGMALDVEFRGSRSLNPTAIEVSFPTEQARSGQ